MIGVIVTFQYDDGGADRERILKIASDSAPRFEGVAGLRSKVFTLDESNARATNVYVWDSEDAARAFFDDALIERVTALYGVRPTVDFVEIAALVDNS
jgi:heme-degrading monooxygenase HmoA